MHAAFSMLKKFELIAWAIKQTISWTCVVWNTDSQNSMIIQYLGNFEGFGGA